ncbi:MAG: FAD-dependent oxidoreductase [Candidatus Aenigmarchaeota archaeon]|nr:FAD-dependent oxidoreductase [Candidatus Aenigmarchaeota archaeon]
MEYDTIILGGGLTGLFVGYKLSKKGKKIIIIEKSKELGGLLGSLKTRGCPIEKYYHHVFKTDKNFLELVDEIGIEGFGWNKSDLGFYTDGKIHDMSTPFHLGTFSPLNLLEKIQFVLLALKMKTSKDFEKLDKITAKEWIIGNSSKGLYNKFFRPLLESKYGDNSKKASAAWFIERINMRTSGGLGKENLGYIECGFQQLIDRLEEEILRNGGEILKSKSASKLLIKNKAIQGVSLGRKKIKSKYVVSTIPLPELAKFKELPEKYRKRITSLKYQGAMCLLLGLKKSLSDFYWTNIIDDSLIGAIIEHTNLQPIENYKDKVVYLASYPNYSSDLWKMSDKEVFEEYFTDLRKIFPEIKKKDVNWWKLAKDTNAGILYETGYQKKRVGNKTPVKNLVIGGMFNHYPDRSVEGALVVGNKILELIEN